MTKFNLHGHPWVATEKDVKAPWSCGKPGEYFRCAWCGYRFAIGDTVRCIYTNGGAEDTRGLGGNPLICTACDGPRDEILVKLREIQDAYKADRFWWFRKRLVRELSR